MLRRVFAGLLGLALIVLPVDAWTSPSVAYAAPFAVDSTADLPDVEPNDGHCLTVATTCTLRAAIMQANASAGADTISLPAGTYTLTLVGAGEDAASLGDLDITSAVTINGAGAGSTIVDGNGLDRVFDVLPGASASMSGLTVQHGTVSTSGMGDGGGGIRNIGTLMLDGVTLRQNTAEIGAALVQFGSAQSALTMNAVTVSENTGIGLRIGAVAIGLGTATITGGSISNNSLLGMYVQGSVTVNVTGTVFSGNTNSASLGGGLQISGGTVTLTDIIVNNNETSLSGGGIAINNAAIPVQVTRATITNNRAASLGGGLYVNRATTIVDSMISGNRANRGGGVGAEFNVPATITNTTFDNNEAIEQGGGLLLRNGSVTGGTISNNRAPLGAGAFVSTTGTSTCTSAPMMNGVTVRNNAASGSGGGIFVSAFGPQSIGFTNLTIEGNTSADSAGGLASAQDFGATTMVCGTTIAGNTATGNGGGVAVSRNFQLQDSTISGNTTTGGFGGGIHIFELSSDSAQAVIRRVTIAYNTAPAGRGGNLYTEPGGRAGRLANTIVSNGGAGGNCAGRLPTSLGHNLSSDPSCGFAASGDLQNTDPLLGPLANNGGPTKTHALQSGSPSIDAGDNAQCSPADQRGQPRPIDGNGDGQAVCDIGAYEAPAGPSLPTCTPRPRVAVQVTPNGDGRLRATVSVTANSGQTNELRSINWTSLGNATVQLANGPTVQQGQQTPLAGNTQSVTFLVSRVTAGQAATVRLTAKDVCGDWPTFVGGGPNAF